MKLINEKQIFEEWAPQLEANAGVTEKSKLQWLTKYCHYHALNESSFVPMFNWPAASLQNTPGMGNVRPGTVAGGSYNFYNGQTGSGDKFPSLLPLAIQVGARTVGFDIVPVIPMNGPSGVLTYLDYVYAGGKNNAMLNDETGAANADLYPYDSHQEMPAVIKVNLNVPAGEKFKVGKLYKANGLDFIYVGKSRVDGYSIFRVLKAGEQYRGQDGAWVTSATTATATIADVFGINAEAATIETEGETPVAIAINNTNPSLVKALEDHIQGYAGAGPHDTEAWTGNYMDRLLNPEPMRRGIGEQTAFRTMGLQAFTKYVEAGTYQVAATVTTEQIADLNRQFGIDVVGMVENSLTIEISQHINRHILSRAFALGWSNHSQFEKVEGQNLNMTIDPTTGYTPAPAQCAGKDGQLVTINVPAFGIYGGYENQWTVQRRIFSKILAAGNVIAQRGRRGPANFVVTNLQIATVLQDSAQFTFAPMANTINQNNGSLYPVGAVAGITVYVDPNMAWDDTRVCVGRKGADEEPGLKFMPYLLAESVQTIAEGTMAPKIAVKSRYCLVEAGFHPETQYFTFFVDTNRMSIV